MAQRLSLLNDDMPFLGGWTGRQIFTTSYGMQPLTGGAEHPDHFPFECRDFGGTAGRDQIAVDNDILIHPLRSGILEIGFER